jgi:hypothetical protein
VFNTCLLLQNIFINLCSDLPRTSKDVFDGMFCEVTFCCMFVLRNCYSVPYTIFSISVRYKEKPSADLMYYIMCMTHWKGV